MNLKWFDRLTAFVLIVVLLAAAFLFFWADVNRSVIR